MIAHDSSRPSDRASVVGRPRAIQTVLLVAFLAGFGIPAVIAGDVVTFLIGIPILALALFAPVYQFYSRVWLDGPVLHCRTVRGMQSPVRIDRLTRASLSLTLELEDADGAILKIDSKNLHLGDLYEALALRISPDDPIAGEALQRRLRKYR